MSDEAKDAAVEAAVGAAVDKKAKKAKKPKKPKKPKKAKKAKAARGKAGLAKWRGIDSAIAAVLVANVLLLAVIVSLPQDEDGPETPGGGSEIVDGGGDAPMRKTANGDIPPGGVDTKRVPLLPRNELWQRSQRQAARGDIDEAITSLKLLLRQEPDLGEVPRRAVWLQLSYYAGLVGREEDAARWLRLSKASHETALVPDELMRLAKEAASARDWAESRRYAARFLLQRGQIGRDAAQQIAEAYLLLGDSYRDAAGVDSPIEVEAKIASRDSDGEGMRGSGPPDKESTAKKAGKTTDPSDGGR